MPTVRCALDGSGPPDSGTRELVLLAGFTVGGLEGALSGARTATWPWTVAPRLRRSTRRRSFTRSAKCRIEYAAEGLTWDEKVIASRQQAGS